MAMGGRHAREEKVKVLGFGKPIIEQLCETEKEWRGIGFLRYVSRNQATSRRVTRRIKGYKTMKIDGSHMISS